MSKKLEDYTKEELIEIIKDLKSRKKFGLVWEDSPEDVARLCETELPVLEEVPNRAIQKLEGASNNLIIEGDNYHSLSVLNYTHAGKIDVIYIDPPYNTGARDWRYNNSYVDDSDTFRHSKWLSFMDKRLRLAKNLLADDGMICVTIDDYELPRLAMLLDEIFGEERRLGSVVIRNNPQGRSTVKGFSINHEYALFYGKTTKSTVGRLPRSDKQLERYPETDEHGQGYLWENFRKTGSDSHRKDRPKQFYPLYVRGDSIRLPKMEWDNANKAWLILDKKNSDEVEVWPIDNTKNERVWKWGQERVLAYPNHLQVRRVGGKIEIHRRNYPSEGSLPNTLWDKPKYASGSHGTNLLTRMFGKSHVFDFPKSVYAVEDCIRVCSPKKDAVVLDFFAGSGTTGHAVLNLNKADSGNRRFILCTNNENKIAEEVCYPRIKNVIDGYAEVEGTPANARYFKTSFVSKEQTNDQTRAELVARSTDMICLREDTFEKVLDNKLFKVFCGADHYTVIIFDPDAIGLLKNALANLQDDKPVHIYIFSLSNDTYESDFGDLERSHEVRPIPESILEVYRRIFTSQNKTMGAYD